MRSLVTEEALKRHPSIEQSVETEGVSGQTEVDVVLGYRPAVTLVHSQGLLVGTSTVHSLEVENKYM